MRQIIQWKPETWIQSYFDSWFEMKWDDLGDESQTVFLLKHGRLELDENELACARMYIEGHPEWDEIEREVNAYFDNTGEREDVMSDSLDEVLSEYFDEEYSYLFDDFTKGIV